MEWTDMLVEGGLVTAEWQREAWERIRLLSGDPSVLDAALWKTAKDGRDAPPPSDDYCAAEYLEAIANRMRQRARKAGVIAYDGKPKRWRFVEGSV